VLWIGNSLTLANGGLPSVLEQLAASLDSKDDRRNPTFRMHAVGGAHLADHLSSVRSAVLAIGADWDAVVLQPYSDEAIIPKKQAAFMTALRKLAGTVRSGGAQPWLFMTWPYKNRPGMREELLVAFDTAGQEVAARVVPVGLAFAAAHDSRPDLQLYAEGDVKQITYKVFRTLLRAAVPIRIAGRNRGWTTGANRSRWAR
jgi:hypothetical protein